MLVAMLKHWASGTGHLEQYDTVSEQLGARTTPPRGLVFHTAGSDGDGRFFTFDVWESREHAERWIADHLAPALRAADGPLSVPPDALVVYEVHSLLHPR